MESKKNLPADIHSKRPLIFSFSLVASLTLIITIFEWRWSDSQPAGSVAPVHDYAKDELIEIPPTHQPPVPVPVKPLQQIKSITIVETPDNEKIMDQIEIKIDQEILAESSVEKVPVTPIIEAREVADEIFIIVETPAEFVGGPNALWKFIRSNLQYPKIARRVGVEGTVYVKFVIEKNGSVSSAEIMKGIEKNCDQEALRVINLSPVWKPGKQRGHPVRTQVILPIIFKLRSDGYTPTHY